jgi:thiol-disulfide isomerase/thioredoxin
MSQWQLSRIILGLLAVSLGGLVLAADPPNPDLKRDGAVGFPQAQAKVLWDTADLRVLFWNDNKHLYVQAILWKDGDDALGETADGRPIGDSSTVVLDVDADGKPTPNVDRHYSLNPWPSMPGLHYQVVVGPNATTGLRGDSKGRGSIRYLPGAGGGKVRVDSVVIPLAEINRRPGDKLRLAYWGTSPKPELTVNSVGYEQKGSYYSHQLPLDKFHEVTLADRAGTLDFKEVPDGREDPCPLPKKDLKPMPRVGTVAPEVSAKDWLNCDGAPRLADLRGKVVLVELWATWCGPCVRGIPHLNDLHDRYGPKGLRILSFTDQSKKGIEAFVARMPITYTVGAGSDLYAEYGVSGIPHAFLIGKDSKILWSGNPGEEALEKAITAAVDAVHAEPPSGDASQGDKPFDEITLKRMKELIDRAGADKETQIDGSDNKDKQLPEGAILCYVTSDKHYGKLKVLEYGYNLAVKWVTYDNDGGVLSKGDRLVVKGTWEYDLDYGVEGGQGKSKADFWWEQVDRRVRHLVFKNGAVFAVYRDEQGKLADLDKRIAAKEKELADLKAEADALRRRFAPARAPKDGKQLTVQLVRTSEYSRTDFGDAFTMVWAGDVKLQGKAAGEFTATLTKTTKTGKNGAITQYDLIVPGNGPIAEFLSIRTNHIVTGNGSDHGTIFATSPAYKLLLAASVDIKGGEMTIKWREAGSFPPDSPLSQAK